MITAGRFMLQSRLFYHMLQNRALIDFHNYKISRDIFVIVVIGGCFLMSVVHIAMDIFLPPHAGVQRLTNICTVYLVPCAIFFGLYDSASDVERHFVPLTKFYEENPLHAKVHLGASELYLEEELKSASVKSRQRTRSAAQGDTYSLNQLLDETLKVAQPYEGKIATASTPLAPVAHRSKTSRNLFKGLWPARILLDPRLDDQDSIGFKHAWLAFSVMFVLIQAAVLVSLVSSGLGELWDAQADHYPYGTVEVNGSHYEHVGVGYCRELGMKIPDGYYTALSNLVAPPNIAAEPPAPRRGLAVAKISAPRNAKAPRSNAAAAKRKKAQSSSRSISVQPDVLPYSFLETRSDLNPLKKKRDPEAAALEEWHHDSEQTCAKHCSSNPNCGAYAVDQDKCTIYLKVAGQAPQGWSDFIERAAAHQGPAVVQQTNGAYGVDCWGKLDGQEDPHEYMGALVCFSFAAIVFMVAVVAIWQLRKHVLE
eukprot:CAMPEP_0172683368 /NCGR_PEP_ID=MMETSP1074-20121228/18801_1 /TAXON_ID=2916 /ORGANISM="Ceratium fusus, Strain PA161109" /LENGTH=480 /DNA_ID=CAMNT_0013502205 /DNA_START=380 /DNA_END=1822 /DNA_ORIENTATION=+